MQAGVHHGLALGGQYALGIEACNRDTGILRDTAAERQRHVAASAHTQKRREVRAPQRAGDGLTHIKRPHHAEVAKVLNA